MGILARIRKAARDLLTLDESDPKRIFEGQALINRMLRIGVLSRDQLKLDYVLGLTTKQFLDRRLQTIVFQSNNAKSIHQARTLIHQKKILSIRETEDKSSIFPHSLLEKKMNLTFKNYGKKEKIPELRKELLLEMLRKTPLEMMMN